MAADQGKSLDASNWALDELPMNARKEQFCLGYVRMVAAAAGCSVKSHETDYDGVDITIASSTEYELFYCPNIELQLKCTSQNSKLNGEHMSWELAAKPFQRLTNPKRYITALLGILLIPSNPGEWLDQDESRLLSQSRMYWESATRLGSLGEGMASRAVHLPRSNLFTPDQLLGIMKTIGDGGDL